jgi:hypothetical protein
MLKSEEYPEQLKGTFSTVDKETGKVDVWYPDGDHLATIEDNLGLGFDAKEVAELITKKIPDNPLKSPWFHAAIITFALLWWAGGLLAVVKLASENQPWLAGAVLLVTALIRVHVDDKS